MYRGDVALRDIGGAMAKIKVDRAIQFVDWWYNWVKMGLHYESPKFVPGEDLGRVSWTLLMVANTTAITQK
jgi:tubulin alpha